uniref:Homing endonuclease LAGLIDADG domain-containing protein n=1 Tax=Cyclocybe aegerita TaxID=1973307 RepID=A0A884P6L0_CYCAE|nr:hypothetical protein K4014_mgp32 [Cyclocybe aegerita]YP_010146965.1 hypothetical protein K4014_mgp02 [Cyclocybe aegerita]QQP21444.1 hypothetical protein [Cyclocybe aegerita]QQP21474.1 hypothetical protein [Cyclocybe aegerita]
MIIKLKMKNMQNLKIYQWPTLKLDFTKSREDVLINPNWVTGFIDGEGSFIIAIIASTGATKKKVSLRLSVTQKSHSVGVLYDLQKFFGCGSVIPSSKDCMRFVVQKKEDLFNKIIPHFISYPLITSKGLNFDSFREASEIVKKGEHLNLEGLNKIINIKNKMNTNRSFDDLFNYLIKKEIKLNPHWIQAFVDAEGSFGTLITKSSISKKVVTRNRLSISQSTHDYFVLKAIKDFFKSGYLDPKVENIDNLDKALQCKDSSFYYNSSPESILPFFDEYPMYTRKLLDYLDFKKFFLLKKDKRYLTTEGFEEMASIAKNMNSGRSDISNYRRIK